MEGDSVPVVEILFGLAHQFQFLFWIIYECAELVLVGFAHGHAEDLIDLASDHTRSVLQHMGEGCRFAVKVGQEMFGSFGQTQYGFEVDDFGCRARYCRELLGKESQIPCICFYIVKTNVFCHLCSVLCFFAANLIFFAFAAKLFYENLLKISQTMKLLPPTKVVTPSETAAS